MIKGDQEGGRSQQRDITKILLLLIDVLSVPCLQKEVISEIIVIQGNCIHWASNKAAENTDSEILQTWVWVPVLKLSWYVTWTRFLSLCVSSEKMQGYLKAMF